MKDIRTSRDGEGDGGADGRAESFEDVDGANEELDGAGRITGNEKIPRENSLTDVLRH